MKFVIGFVLACVLLSQCGSETNEEKIERVCGEYKPKKHSQDLDNDIRSYHDCYNSIKE